MNGSKKAHILCFINNNNNCIACKASGLKYIEQYIEQLSKCRESATLSLYSQRKHIYYVGLV